jgi:hypothetical protein
MAHRSRNPRRAKALRCYTVAEAAELYGVHRNTVRNWQANGLESVDDSRPTLFHGTALNAFHQRARSAGKKRCGPGEIFCLSCREPRPPALGMVDYMPTTATLGTLTGLCAVCGNIMGQKVNGSRLAAFSAQLGLPFGPAPAPLVKSSASHLDCDLAPEVNGHEVELRK